MQRKTTLRDFALLQNLKNEDRDKWTFVMKTSNKHFAAQRERQTNTVKTRGIWFLPIEMLKKERRRKLKEFYYKRLWEVGLKFILSQAEISAYCT